MLLLVNVKGACNILILQEEKRLSVFLDEVESAINIGNWFTHEEVFGDIEEKIKRLNKGNHNTRK